jgi:hypothetical protein
MTPCSFGLPQQPPLTAQTGECLFPSPPPRHPHCLCDSDALTVSLAVSLAVSLCVYSRFRTALLWLLFGSRQDEAKFSHIDAGDPTGDLANASLSTLSE